MKNLKICLSLLRTTIDLFIHVNITQIHLIQQSLSTLILAWFLAQVIDHLYRERISIGKQYGAGAQDGLKTVVEELSRLRYL